MPATAASRSQSYAAFHAAYALHDDAPLLIFRPNQCAASVHSHPPQEHPTLPITLVLTEAARPI